ncbi:MAG: transposase domain-containing protein [Lachnospiraceae bacterium]|jgi:hypothetical protein|nr:transposase domain-containing protein [Lachnospiraceae bacterium]
MPAVLVFPVLDELPALFFYSIVETAKANHLNPFWYFTHLLTVLPELRRKYGTIDAAPVAELDRLPPWSKELPDNCHSKRR